MPRVPPVMNARFPSSKRLTLYNLLLRHGPTPCATSACYYDLNKTGIRTRSDGASQDERNKGSAVSVDMKKPGPKFQRILVGKRVPRPHGSDTFSTARKLSLRGLSRPQIATLILWRDL